MASASSERAAVSTMTSRSAGVAVRMSTVSPRSVTAAHAAAAACAPAARRRGAPEAAARRGGREHRDPAHHVLGLAARTSGRVVAHRTEPFEEVPAGRTFVLVERHGWSVRTIVWSASDCARGHSEVGLRRLHIEPMKAMRITVLLLTEGLEVIFAPEIYLDPGRAALEAERWAQAVSGGRAVLRPLDERWSVGERDVRLVSLAVAEVPLSPWLGTYWDRSGTPDPEAALFTTREEAKAWVDLPPHGATLTETADSMGDPRLLPASRRPYASRRAVSKSRQLASVVVATIQMTSTGCGAFSSAVWPTL